jgi:hypothetical protein
MIGVILLAKLAKLIYRKDLHMQRECVLMASEMCFTLLRTSMPNPQNIRELGLYRLKDLANNAIFDHREDMNPCELLYYLNQLAMLVVDYDLQYEALPIVTLMEHLSNEIVPSEYYSVKAKLIKSICLAKFGMINEALQYLLRVQNKKDNFRVWVKNSEYIKLSKGVNFSFTDSYFYHNDITPYDDRNQEVLDKIIDMGIKDNLEVLDALINLELNKDYKFHIGFVNFNLFH